MIGKFAEKEEFLSIERRKKRAKRDKKNIKNQFFLQEKRENKQLKPLAVSAIANVNIFYITIQ